MDQKVNGNRNIVAGRDVIITLPPERPSPPLLYQTEDGSSSLDVQLVDETVWLTQAQMQELFGRERSVLTKHINNVFKEGELDKERVCAKFAHTAADGKTYQVAHYNLDVIISVGYRVKSKRGTQFRIWATTVLKQHLVQGYTLHQQRLAEKGTAEVRQVLDLLSNTLESHGLVSADGRSVLSLVKNYARTWQLLWQYDEDSLSLPKAGTNGRVPETALPTAYFFRKASNTARVGSPSGAIPTEL
ncbi:MAG: hypothetical protein D3908_09260 [Candidatus Electrothrix sp. AUS4]|nr:hypothetical protein [Candidatus Electrothrix sp. AUS4]